MTLSEIAAALTGERMMTKHTGGGPEHPSRDEIARLAYHFYECGGGGMARMSTTGYPPSANSCVTIGSRQPTLQVDLVRWQCPAIRTVTRRAVARSC